MATHTGSAGTVKVGSNAVAELKSWSLDQSQDTVETTKLGDTVKTYSATQSSSSGTMDCFWDETDTNGPVACSIGVAQTHDGIVERSIGFQITGAVTIGTV